MQDGDEAWDPVPSGADSVSRLQAPADSAAHAYQEVRAAILDGTLAPGSMFSQVQLAARLGISRTPLREALRQLRTEGLVQGNFNRRVEVAPLSLDDLEALYALRIALESLGVRLTIPRLTASDTAELAAALARMQEAALRRDAAGIREPHRCFHFTLFGHAGERLVRELSDLWDHAERYRRLYQDSLNGGLWLMDLAGQEHLRMLELAQAGEAVAAGRLIARHLARTAVTVIAQVDGAHDPAMVREALRHVVEGEGGP
jgi:DNA-binding GntR family transcriptional regulator